MRFFLLTAGLMAGVAFPALAQSPGSPDAAAMELQGAWDAEAVDYQHMQADHQRVENAIGGFVRERSQQVAELTAELAKARARPAVAPTAAAHPIQPASQSSAVHPPVPPAAAMVPGSHPVRLHDSAVAGPPLHFPPGGPVVQTHLPPVGTQPATHPGLVGPQSVPVQR